MKLNKTLFFFIKILLVLSAFSFIAYKLFHYKDLDAIWSQIKSADSHNMWYLLLAFLLIFINWGLESLKWKYLISKLESIPYPLAVKATCAGIAVSIFTPNRVGELFGRVFVLKKENRGKAVFSTTVGSLSQLLITLMAGILSLSVFLWMFPQMLNQYSVYSVYSIPILLTLTTLFFCMFLQISYFEKLIARIPFLKKYREYYSALAMYKKRELLYILLLSFLRYMVFVSQYYLLLRFFNVEITYFTAVLTIAITYLFATFVPSITLADFGVRGAFALIFISLFSINDAGIVSSTILLWILNLVLPSIVGSYFVLRYKV